MKIPIDKILPNPEQPRKDFDAEELQGLANSIREQGVIQAITVEEAGEKYILHDGERRWRAAKIAGLLEIPALIVPSSNGKGQQDRLMRALVANIQRADLNPIEEARAYERLQKDHQLTTKRIAELCGVNWSRVQQRLDLVKYDPEIQELIARRKFPITIEIRKVVMDIPDREARIEFASKAAEACLSNKGIIQAAIKLKKQLEEAKYEKFGTPMVNLAVHNGRPNIPKWDMLSQVGSLPPWSLVIVSARDTCDACILRPMASETTCSECPGVQMIRNLILHANQGKKHG